MLKSVTSLSVETLSAIARHYFGDLSGVISLPDISVPGVGVLVSVLARHEPMRPEIQEFVLISAEDGLERSAKRSQLKVICRFWEVKSYVVVSERQYEETIRGHVGSCVSYNPNHFIRLVVCRASQDADSPPSYQFASVENDAAAISQHVGTNLPSREEFSRRLSKQLRRTMLTRIRQIVKEREANYG